MKNQRREEEEEKINIRGRGRRRNRKSCKITFLLALDEIVYLCLPCFLNEKG